MLAKKALGIEFMRAARRLLTVILIVTVLFSGLPLFSPEDTNRDRRVDLEDAIVALRGLQALSEIRAWDSPAEVTLRSRLEKAMEAFKALVGEKSLVSPKEGKALSSSIGHFVALLPSFSFEPLFRHERVLFPGKESFLSIDIEPLTPPPRSAC
jgi:hypothetical protein